VNTETIDLHESWLAEIGEEFGKPYMRELKQFLRDEKTLGKVVFPAGKDMFNALNSTPFDDVKVVILGQDPYHGPDQAHGLCFSVRSGVATPPSLKNIYKELHQSLQMEIPAHGNLQGWADQGVLLLNATLSVEQAQAGSHQGKGWEVFTDAIIHALNDKQENIVFVLWGSYAQKKAHFVNAQKHCVLKSSHPSPLSAYRGFLGSNHFAQVNSYLEGIGKTPIDWAHLPLPSSL